MPVKPKMFESFDDAAPKEPKIPTPSRITATTLAELDLDKELLTQYKNALILREDTEHDEEIPLSQKAQLLNTINSILTSITKSQTELYDAERLKLYEGTLVTVLKKFPDVSEAFFKAYEEALKNA